MKLKRLQLQGYKTFASKTEFDFSSGITAVVGPNGSGKSNIADAIRWVLGEQSYSTLRGKRTIDMIFAGSQTRARAGMAQAILTLDNADGWLPIDYAEVEIGRRAYRSGENEYLLNGQKVRLRDVQDLLATSGLAERTYTIIGQGLIDQALSLRAEERRALFEEAAGVSHYQSRRAETLRRLQETQHNIERVHDILSEIRPRLGTLKRQASRAQTFGQVEADLRQLLRIWYGYQWEERKRALRAQRVRADEAEAGWSASRDAIAATQENLSELRRKIAEIQKQVGRLRLRREELRERRETSRREVAVLGERATLLRREIEESAEELQRLETQRENAQVAVDEALSGLQAAQKELSDHVDRLERFNLGFEAQQEAIDHWTAMASRLEKERDYAQKRLAQTEGQLAELRERIAQQKNGQDSAEELIQLEAKIDELVRSVNQAQEHVSELHAQRQQLREKMDSARRDQQSELKNQKRLTEELALIKERVARLESRCDLLDQMRDQKLQIGEDVRVVGRIAALLDFSASHRTALESALGARLNTVVVEDERSLKALLNGGQNTKSFFAAAGSTIISPSTQLQLEDSEAIGWGIDYVEASKDIEALARLLLQSVLLVNSRQAALRLGRQLHLGALAVAPDGFIVHAGGLVEVTVTDPRQSILAREEAWRAARGELLESQADAVSAKQAIAERQTTIETQEKHLAQLHREAQQIDRLAHEAEQKLNHAQRDLDRARQRHDFVQKEQDARRQEVVRLEQRFETVKTGIDNGRGEVVRLESAVQEARLQLQELPIAEAEQQRRSRRQEIDGARTIVAGRQAVVESRRATLQQVDAQIRRLQERLDRFGKEQKTLDLARRQKGLSALQKDIEQIDTQLNPLNIERQRLQEQLTQMEETLGREQRKAHDLETQYTQAKVALSQRENQLEGLVERIRADLGLVALQFDEEHGGQTPLPMDEVVEQLPDVAELPENIEQSIRDYRGQLHRIGSVNPDAPMEFEQTQERYDFLTQQIEDLSQTEKRLRTVISELDDLTSQAFAETVDKVDGIFAELFERLFGGGSAQLVLTEPDDLTVSGVDIICRLPNRRQQRLGLLSGGERSLTATALIFALLKVAPPPFCVMDEVDAMLDEANINRFRNVLHDLAHQSQFIVITHNRGTVQAARTVYGVSMGTDSASQVISIRPEEYVNGNQ